MNNGKYHTKEYKVAQAKKVDRQFGPIKKHKKVCERCENKFIFEGRLNTKEYQRAKYCSRKCSNNRQDWWNKNAVKYTTIAWQTWEKKCIICGFDKIVAVHHNDENKKNNKPNNLIPLCPNHHQMVHSRFKNEILPIINRVVKEKFGPVV